MKSYVTTTTQGILLVMIFSLNTLALKAQKLSTTVTLDVKEEGLEAVFMEIKKQTNFSFVYSTERMKQARPVTYKGVNVPLKIALDSILKDQPFTYSRESSLIILRGKETAIPPALEGTVVDSGGDPIQGVTVEDHKGKRQTSTDADGTFYLSTKTASTGLKFTCIGYQPFSQTVQAGFPVTITLQKSVNELDKVVTTGYSKTSLRIYPGVISSLDKRSLTFAPNVNEALRDGVAGLLLSTPTGLPNSSAFMEIRGYRTIDLGNFKGKDAPLILIDNVPFTPGARPLNTLMSLSGDPSITGVGASPLQWLNVNDIESIDVLKDAVATSIYGAKAANGVILITTKKSKTKGLRINLDLSYGWGNATMIADVLDTEDYRRMRGEGLSRVGASPDPTELRLWDSNAYTNMQKLLFGKTAQRSSLHLAVSYGKKNTFWLFSYGEKSETYIVPADVSDRVRTWYANMNWQSPDKRLKVSTNNFLSTVQSNSMGLNIMPALYLSPNVGPLKDSAGRYVYSRSGLSFENPLSWSERKYTSRTNLVLTNWLLEYTPFTGLKLKTNLGYSSVRMDELSIVPVAGLSPAQSFSNSFDRGITSKSNWVIEPQINYDFSIRKIAIGLMAGSSFQKELSYKATMQKGNFASDSLLFTAIGQQWIYPKNEIRYAYYGNFFQVNLNWRNKVMANFSVRRDASTRFSAENRVGIFSSAGININLSQNDWDALKISWINFFQLRASYGSTGNEIAEDFKYYNLYARSPAAYQYAGYGGIYQLQPYIRDYRWENTRKLNVGITADILKMINVAVDYYINISDDQIIALPISSQAGFNAVEQISYPVVVANRGLELTIRKKRGDKKNYLSVTGQLTLPRNRLEAFPGQENYHNYDELIVGKPLSARRLYKFVEVDPNTGRFVVADSDGDGKITPNDKTVIRDLEVRYYGSFNITVGFDKLSISMKAEIRNQPMPTSSYYMYSRTLPGMTDANMFNNQPVEIKDRWRQSGDKVAHQYVSASPDAEEQAAIMNYTASDASIENVTYGCWRTVNAAYDFDPEKLKRFRIKAAQVFVQVQNLLVVSNRKSGNPSLSNPDWGLPALRMFTTGIKITF